MSNFLANLFVSSADPNKVSATIHGLLVANIGLVMFVFQQFNLPYTVEEVMSLIGLVSTAIGAIWVAFGATRKVYYFLKNKKVV